MVSKYRSFNCCGLRRHFVNQWNLPKKLNKFYQATDLDGWPIQPTVATSRLRLNDIDMLFFTNQSRCFMLEFDRV
jgi:hypothetical protein